MRVTVPLTPEQEALLAREKAESEKLESYCVVTLTVTLAPLPFTAASGRSRGGCRCG